MTRRYTSALVAALVAATSGGATAHAEAPVDKQLSDETTETLWAIPVHSAAVYRGHSAASGTVGRLRMFTEDRFAEVYVALASHTDATGREWIKVRLPQRPNGRTGWVAREALGDFKVNRLHLLIDRSRLRAVLRSRGKVVWQARVGVGKRGTATPAGNFYVRETFKVSGQPMYGTFAIGTSAYSPTLSDWPKGGIIGIHGTNQPGLIPGRPSHGCVRVRNADMAKLRKLIRIGTPIRIK